MRGGELHRWYRCESNADNLRAIDAGAMGYLLKDAIHHGTFDVTTGEHRQIKGIMGRQNLRDSKHRMRRPLRPIRRCPHLATHAEFFGDCQLP